MSSHPHGLRRVRLEELKIEEHAHMFFELHSDPRCMAWSSNRLHTGLDDSVTLMQQSMPTPDKPWNRRYAIILPDADAVPNVTGTSKLIGIVGTPRDAEIAYKLHPDFWGRGYMSEALSIFLDLFWSDEVNKDYRHIVAFADDENIASQRVLEKARFRRGRRFVNHYVRAVNVETQKRSNLQTFFLDRPGTITDWNDDWILQLTPSIRSLSEEDVASIRNVLENDGVTRGRITS